MARGMTCWICWNSQSWLGCLQFVGTSNWALLEYINAGSAKTEPLLGLCLEEMGRWGDGKLRGVELVLMKIAVISQYLFF